MTVHVSYIGHLSDRVQDLYYGKIGIEGVDLHFIPSSPAEAFRRLSESQEFDAGEMSLATYIIQRSKGDDTFIAIPVFPSRTFRHSAIYINRNANIHEPRDLIGRRVGVPEYQMTAALWVRGMLQHEYSVMPQDVTWFTGGLQDIGRLPLIPTEVQGVTIIHIADKSLDQMLWVGELDAIVAPQSPPSFRAGHPDIIRLFPNYTELERQYFRKTGLFPIMHTVVLRKALYVRFPWVAVALFEAFQTAKDNCLRRLATDEPLPISLPWIQGHVQEILSLMGDDFWPYGIEPNRKTLEAACQYAYEQGLTSRRVGIDELFAPNVLNLHKYRSL